LKKQARIIHIDDVEAVFMSNDGKRGNRNRGNLMWNVSARRFLLKAVFLFASLATAGHAASLTATFLGNGHIEQTVVLVHPACSLGPGV
jgi:saccharopine dehydrogenase-like NADP-dependent oxidoreductase